MTTKYRLERVGVLDEYEVEFAQTDQSERVTLSADPQMVLAWPKAVAWEMHKGIGLRPYVQRFTFSPSALISRSEKEVEAKFAELAQSWRELTRAESSVMKRVMHPTYQRVIGLGPQAVPFIIRELHSRPDHWFWALASIVGSDEADGAETFKEAVRRWTEWAETRGATL